MEGEKKKDNAPKLAAATVFVVIGLALAALSLIIAAIGSGGWVWLLVIGGIFLASALFSKSD